MDENLRNGIINIAKNMVTAMTNTSLYSTEHSQVKRYLEKAHASILDLLKDRDNITFVIIEGDLIADNYRISAGIFLSKFTENIQRKGIGSLTFTAGLTQEELMSFIRALALPAGTESEVSSSPNIKIGNVEVKIRKNYVSEKQDKEVYDSIGSKQMHEFMEIYEDMEEHKKIDVIGLQKIITNIMNAFKEEINPLKALAPMKSLDEYTFTHSVNVCILTILQAMRLGFEGQILHDMGIAALLHDVGKLFVPEEILSKDAKLNEEEWRIIREHPIKGAVYLMDIVGIPGLSVVVAFEHHLRYDFSGYPKVKPGWKQNLCSQMTALSDVFDAMRTYKKYRAAIAEEEILPVIAQESGKDFNPFLAENFIKMVSNKESRE